MLNRFKGILYDITLFFAASGIRKHRTAKALIVRVDEIGDFMLWQNFIPEIVQSERLKGYKLHFCGNRSWKSIFDLEYPHLFQQTIWLDKISFKKKLFYRFQFLRIIYKERYDIIINPTYSRAKRIDDAIVRAAKAKRRVGMNRNQENYAWYEMNFDQHLYTDLFIHKEKPVFEFYRNRLFTEYLTGKKSPVQNITFNSENIAAAIDQKLPEKFFVVFPGSRSKSRIWPASHFIEVSNYLFQQFGWTAVICGAHNDAVYAKNFIEQYQHPMMNIVGNTSLPEMLLVLKKANCLLSVDTGSVHLASAVGCTVFGIYNGSQYGRFAPYPKELKNNFFAIYPDEVERDIKENKISKYELISSIPYLDISPAKVLRKINLHYSSI